MIPASTVREAINATPFRPFRIRTAAQVSYEILRPTLVTISPKGSYVGIWNDDDGIAIVDVAQIAGIDLMEPGDAGDAER